MADQQYEPFSGKLDAAPEFVPFDGTLDGEKPKPRGAIRAMADLGVGVASGVVGVSKAAANVAGAGNTVSNVLDSADKTVQGWLSPQAQADQQEIAAHMSDAKAKGLNLEGVKAGAKAFATAPGQFAAQAVGSAAPFIASALTGPLLPTALGVAVGMGTSKGAIYDEIKKRGGTEEEAIKAQEYGGPNKDQIALGGALGVADALTGVAGAGGRMLRGALRKPVANAAVDAAQPGAIRRMATGVASEAPLEAVQGGQEQVAANMAAQRAGYEAGTWDNVASNATLEALASAGPGAAFGLADKAPAAVKPPVNTVDVGGSAGQGLAGTEPAPTRVEAMGINPVGGPLQAAAAMAVDSGAHDVEIAKQAAMVATDTAPPDGAEEKSIDFAKSQNQPISGENAAISGQSSLISQIDSGINPATGEIISAFDQREADKPASLPGDVFVNFDDKPLTNRAMAGSTARRLTEQTGTPHVVQQLGPRQFVARPQEPADVQSTNAVQPLPAADSGSGRTDSGPSVVSGNPDELGRGAEQVGPAADNVVQPGADAGRTDAAPVAKTNPQPTTMGTQRNVNAGPGFSAKDVVKAEPSSPAPSQGQPDQTPTQVEARSESPAVDAAQTPVQPAAETQGQPTPVPSLPKESLPSANDTTTTAEVQNVDAAAHQAATSPLNDKPEPTDGQKKAGNYTKGHTNIGGLDLAIENPAGSTRSGTDKSGKAWENTLQHHYGYIKGTIGNDKDHVDAFVKPGTPAEHTGPVYVVDQIDPDTGKFDEHKVVIGAKNGMEARRIYQTNYAKGWKGMKAITPMPFDEFKTWVKDGPKNAPLSPDVAPVSSTTEKPSEPEANQTLEATPKREEAAKPSPDEPAAGPGVGDAGEGAAAKPTSLREAIERKQNEPTNHAGLKIYPIKIKVGDKIEQRWGVQTPRNAEREKNGERQIGGDPLSDTLDGAKKLAEQEVATAKDQQERSAAHDANAAAVQAKKDANKGKSILQRRADALLDKQHTYPPQAGLGQGTRREAMQKAVDQGRAIVERMVPDTAAKHRDQTAIDLVKARGYILGLSNENIPVVKQGLEAQARMKANQYEKPEYRVYDSAKTDGGFYEITKTEFDYAKSLAEKPAEVDAWKESERKSAEQDEKQQWVYDYAKGLKWDEGSRESAWAKFSLVWSSKDRAGFDSYFDAAMEKLPQPTPATPVHQDPGKAPEVATAPVVAKSIAKAANNEDKSQKEMRLWLLGEIDKAVKLTEDYADYQDSVKKNGQDIADSIFFGKRSSSTGLTTPQGNSTVTFDVPGDGKFKIRNSLRGLMEFRAKVEAKSGTGFTDKPTKPKGLPASTGVAKGSSNQIEALSNMLEELDFEAAVDYARETGVSLNDAKVPPHIRDQLTAYLKDGTLPPAPFSPTRYWEYQASSRADKDGNPIREASLTKEIGADTYIANVTGTNATGFTFTVTKGAETFEKKSGTFRTFSDALQGAESKIASIPPEVVKQKDTGWNMAGVGFAGKRYRGRNITLDDGREVVARIYENAGQYEDAEVKVDGVSKFRKTDRYKAEKLADDFIRTLMVKQPVNETQKAFEEEKQAKAQEEPGIDLMGFTRTPTGNGAFKLVDGNMMVMVEPTSYGFQAKQGSSAKSGPRLTEQQAIEWAANVRNESKAIQSKEAKPAQVKPDAAASVPKSVQDHVKWALTQLRDIEDALESVRRARGDGHILALEVKDQEAKQVRPNEILDEFREHAKKNGIDAEAVIDALGGVPDLARFSQPASGGNTEASQREFRNPDNLNVLHAPIEDKDWFKLKNGEEWQARQGYSGRGWSLVRNGNLHPEARNFESQADFIRSVIEVTGQTQAAGQVVAPVEANDESIPAVTEAQARKQFEWRNMGQKDGTKSHLLFFFESEKDKGTGAAMNRGEVSLYPGASGWKVEDGDGTSYKSLADAKKAAIDRAIPILQDQGYILKPAQAATAILDAANVTGKERIDALKDVKSGTITPDELKEAYPAKEPAAKIEDAGAKIGGARKDRWKERGLDLNDLDSMSESEGAELATKANVWKPDYEAMAEATEPVTAAMVKTVYDQLAAQPKINTPEGRRNYVTMMQAVRKAYLEAKSPDDVRNAGQKIKTEIGLYSTDPEAKAKARTVLFSVYKGRSDPFVLSYNELSKAKKLVEDGFPAKGEPWKKRLSIRADGGRGMTPRGIEALLKHSAELGTPLTTDQIVSGVFEVVSKAGHTLNGIVQGRQTYAYLPTKADAEAAAKTIYERDLKGKDAEKPEPKRPHLDKLTRENLAQRIDRDVTADDFVNDFSFRGIEFGNWAAQDERQRIINMAYDGLMDLAEIMGVPPKAMSLNGTLGMAFGARGGGKFAAHYEPGKLVINMTKLQGGGSMAHEFAHALDHYFGELNKPDAYTTAARGASGWYTEDAYKGVPRTRMEKIEGKWTNVSKMRLDNLRPEMAAAFDNVMSALFSGQETKAEMIRSEELRLERNQTLYDRETDPDTKAMYLRGVESQKQHLEELRKDPEDKLYPKGRSQYAKQAQALSGKSANGYWARPTEMFARAFESWVFDKVVAMGARSDYLVHGVEEDRFAGGGYKGNPYPTGEERANINATFDQLVSTIQTKETDKGVAMFSRQESDAATGPIDRATLDAVVARVILREKSNGQAPIVVARFEDLPAPILAAAKKQGYDNKNPKDRIKGVAYFGRVYLVQENIQSELEAEEALLHEATHIALRASTSKSELQEMLGALYSGMGGGPGMVALASQAGVKMNGIAKQTANLSMPQRALLATEEFLAEVEGRRAYENLPERAKRVLREFVGSLRKWLREHGFTRLAKRLGADLDAVTLSDLNHLLKTLRTSGVTDGTKVVRFMRSSESGGMAATDNRIPAMNRGTDPGKVDQTETESFRKWFGDSKVVDDAGNPLVVYHGTAGNFGVFDGEKASTASMHATSYLGHFFSESSEIANDFVPQWTDQTKWPMRPETRQGGNVMPVYLAINKPYAMPLAEFRAMVPNGRSKSGVADAKALQAKLKNEGYDGIHIVGDKNLTDTMAGSEWAAGTWIAFDPRQIKSAIGNNGNFDSTNPDIRFSRSMGDTLNTAANSVKDMKLPAGYLVGDLINSAPGKLNWWHKTVGTQYNLAQRSAPFKRVFDSVQRFINDVSFYATEAADLAPNILPKLETWKDITKTPLSAQDTKAISAPIFEGTLIWARDESGKPVKMTELEGQAAQLTVEQKAQRLMRNQHITEQILKMWQGLPIDQYETIINGKYERDMLKAGIVWTPAELKSLFKLTDKQVGLYQEFRTATNKSLTNLAVSDMLRYGGDDVSAVRDQALSAKTPEDAANILADHLRELSELIPERETVLMNTANVIIDKGDRAADLMKRGYAPLSRFGQYTLDVVSKEGERVYFGMFENKFDAARMAREMEKQFPGARITRGTVSEQAYKMFAGVSPETLELFGNMLGLEANGDSASAQVFQEYLKLAKSNRSSMKRLIERKGISGFSEDSGRVLAGFVYSNARQTASNLHMGEMTQAAGDNQAFGRNGELQDAAVKLVDYIKNPQEEAQQIRGLLFAQYIGGSVASAMVNLTQPLTMTFPWLSQFGGVRKAASQMAAATKDALKKTTGDKALDAALHRAEEDGTVSPQEVHQLMQQSMGKGALRSGDGTKSGDAMALAQNSLSRISLAWGKLFSVAEQFNRRSTFIAAYRTAVEQGMRDPDAFARRAIAETQGIYNKGNKPAWARGAVGSTLFVFKQFGISYVEMISRMAKSGPEGKKAALLALAVLFLVSGAGGLPGADDLDDLISGALQALGYNFDSKAKRKEFFAGIVGEGGAQFLERGLSGLPGVPIDVSGRLGLGNLIPGTGLFTKKTDHTTDVAEIAGPAGDLAKRTFQAAGQLVKGEVGGAVNTVSATAIQNLTKAYDMANMGMYRDQSGKKVIDTDTTDAIAKAIGFQPNDVKKVQDAGREVQRMIALNKMRETEIADQWAKGLFEKDPAKVQAARDDLARWNADNPESPIRISFSQVLKRVKAMNQTKEQRLIKTAPKEIRNTVREELAAAR